MFICILRAIAVGDPEFEEQSERRRKVEKKIVKIVVHYRRCHWTASTATDCNTDVCAKIISITESLMFLTIGAKNKCGRPGKIV